MPSWEQGVARLLRALRLDSIRSKLLVFALLATLIPSFTTAWISYQQNKRSLTEKVTRELQSVSAQTAREMDLWVKERLYELRVFASSYEVSENLDRMARGGPRGGEQPRGRLRDYLRSVRERFSDYQELLVVDSDGGAMASSAPEPTPSHLPRGWPAAIRAENAVVGDAYWDDALKQGVVVFAVPIYQTGGRLLGALTAKVDLAAVYRLLRRFTAGDSSRLYLITADGRALVGSRSGPAELTRRSLDAGSTSRLLEREGSVVEYTGLEGERVVGALKRVPQLDWAVLAEVPASEAFRQVARLRNVTAVIVAALFVGVGLLAYFLGLLISRPLDRLREGAAKVAGGDLAVVLPIVSGGELGYVTEVFNDMTARLRDSHRELERLSVTDDLTALFNRRYLMDILELEIRRSRRMHHPFAVLMVDVDNFKPYNDAYGHLEGDTALARIAAILRETSRDVDYAARYGGEEFVVLMPETEMAGAVEMAERIRARLAGDAVIGEKLTISVGVAQFPVDGETPEALLARADAALYQAKRDGRNRIVRSAR
ncbi:MAG TPA: diguanylate cyclase [Gemmatimonadales bacterium]|nr:diguanylate cyclase [Gemmatimonadales bacterium]